jgi:hypothetical protein
MAVMPAPTLVAAALVLALASTAAAQTAPAREAKPGGVLRLVLREDLPQGFSIHETATNSVTWPAMPCYSNLVVYDQLKQLERLTPGDLARPVADVPGRRRCEV